MALSILHMLRCLFFYIPLALAIPSESFSGQHDVHSCSNPSPRSLFAVVRDTIIQTIWHAPSRQRPSTVTSSQLQIDLAPPDLRARYGDDVVLRFNISSDDELVAMGDAAEILYLDVWESTDEWVDVRLAKNMVAPLLGLLPPSLHNAHTPLMHDLAQAIYESYPSGRPAENQPPFNPRPNGFTPSLRRPQDSPDEGRELFFKDYQPMSVLYPWMRLLASMFPTHVRRINIGYSFEGREIPALKVGVHPKNNMQPSEPRKTIIISGGTHAREWISTSTVTYIAYQMITRYGKWPEITSLVEEFDWIFIPTINPDGYVYTWEQDRLWRKNRQETDLHFCQGVDLDRAWSYQWDGAVSRSNPCSESYAGTVPFEGVEAKRLAEWAKNEIANNNVDLVAFLDLHSYSQQVLYPYSYSCSSMPPSLENLEELAMGLAKAIRLTNDHFYGVSSACEGSIVAARTSGKELRAKMDLGGGSALDWFYHELRVKYAYQIKLRDRGSYGFLLPKSNIVPTGQEVFNAVTGLGRFLLGNKGIEIDVLESGNLGTGDHFSQELGKGSTPAKEEVASAAAPDVGDEYSDWEDDDVLSISQELRRRRRKR